MVKSRQDRLRELVERLIGIDGHLCELTIDESRQLERLLRERVSEEEFDFPAFGEE